MYESFYGLSQRPFAAAPVANRYFPASSADAARQTLARCIDRAEGVGLLIGPPGSGKTLLLQVLADQFSDRFSVALLSAGQISSRRELLQAILFELKLPYQGLDEGELHLALLERLTRGEKPAPGLLLLMDEAQTLSPPLLEELRMITNLVREGEIQVRLVLAGGMALEEQLANPRLASFSQRLAARCYLESFDRAESTDYIRFQVAVAGGQAESVFSADAIEAVYRATDGIPRLVNQICDHALLLAHQLGHRPIGASAIEEAWADLQQLPAPWQETGRADSADDVVEFGALDDGEDADENADAWATSGQAELAPEAPAKPAQDERDEEKFAAPIADATETEEAPPHVNGSARPTDTGLKAELTFDEISRHVDSLRQDSLDIDADEVAGLAKLARAESNADAFEIQFEEEEVLVDPYAALDSQRPVSVAHDEADSDSSQKAPAPSDSGDAPVASPHDQQHTDDQDAQPGALGIVASEDAPSPQPCEELHVSSTYEKVEFVVNPYDGLDRPFDDSSAATLPLASLTSTEDVDTPRLDSDSDATQGGLKEELVRDPYATLDEQISQNLAAWDSPPGEFDDPGLADSASSSTSLVTPFSFKSVDDERVTLAEAMRLQERPESDSPSSDEPPRPRLASGFGDDAETDDADWSLEISEDQLDLTDAPVADPAGGTSRNEPADEQSDDLIVVEDDSADENESKTDSQVMRQDYRELFAKLRGG